jgi:hypothetical protein
VTTVPYVFNSPHGLVVVGDGTVLVSLFSEHKVMKIVPQGNPPSLTPFSPLPVDIFLSFVLGTRRNENRSARCSSLLSYFSRTSRPLHLLIRCSPTKVMNRSARYSSYFLLSRSPPFSPFLSLFQFPYTLSHRQWQFRSKFFDRLGRRQRRRDARKV